MIYNEYGSTGVKVSAVGFGGMRFPDHDNWDKGAAAVKHAYDSGINYFDTAPGYGKSEDIYGVAFKEMRKTRAEKPFYVSTKTMKDTPSTAREQLETSLQRMGLEYVDFYHVWCILTLDEFRRRRKNGVLDEFEKMKEEGLIKHICVSSHMTGSDIGVMLKEYPFDGVLLGYSVMNFAYRDEGIQTAGDLGRGVVVMNPLGGGMIPQNPERFSFVRTRANQSVVEGALHFLFNNPRISVSLVGLSDEGQVDDAVRATDNFSPIPSEKIKEIRSSLSESFNELCTGCQYCEKCPQGIPVSQMMDAYNQYMLSGDVMRMINRLRWHWGVSLEDAYVDRCVECGICEQACTQKLPIIARLKEIRSEVGKFLKSEEAKA